MRKTFLYTGLVFLVVGLGFLIISAYMQETILDNVVPPTNKAWEISAHLEKGKNYVIDVLPGSGDNWTTDYTATERYEGWEAPVDFIITSPGGGKTNLTAYFFGQIDTSQNYRVTRLYMIRVDYTSVDSYNLQVDESYPRIRFTTRQEGNYSACIIEQTLTWTSGPPLTMKFFVEVARIQSSRGLVLQSGGVISIAGVVVSLYGMKATKKLKVRQRKKFK